MPNWRRTLYTIWVTQFFAIAGFSFVTPFIPYYIQTLGVSEVGQVALWAGVSTSATAVGLAVMGPVWGAIADRRGRKPMVMRATYAGALIMACMGFASSVEQLVLLRFLQGIFTGTIAASTTLVASIVPEDRRGAALGSLQTAIFLGTTFGPLFGGFSGDTFGYRQSFWVTGALLLLSGVAVTLFVHEEFQPAADAAARPGYRQAVRLLTAAGGGLLAVLAARVLLRGGTLVVTPVLALVVQSLLPSSAHAAVLTGLTSGASAVGGAVGAPLIGGWGDRWGHRRLLIASGAAAALCYLPQAVAPGAGWLVFWQLLGGFAVGGTIACGIALLAECTEHGHEGAVFGLDATGSGLASAAGPLLGASAAATLGLRVPFVLAALVLATGSLVVVWWVRPAKRAWPAPARIRLPSLRGMRSGRP